MIDYLFPTAPEFPQAGEEIECPSCKTKAIYERQDLRYRLW
jgi:DNA-directed RNA polymerase subunit RPC12/RpoP